MKVFGIDQLLYGYVCVPVRHSEPSKSCPLVSIERLRACWIALVVFRCDIQSWIDHVHWFDIDHLRACLKATLVSLCEIQSRVEHAYLFGIDRLRGCSIPTLVSVLNFRYDEIVSFVSLCDIQSQEDHVHWFSIDCLRVCVLIDVYIWRVVSGLI